MKAYTDSEQSKKLAEILPIESADGYWFKGFPAQPYMVYTKGTPNPGEHIPCWSLTALLNAVKYNTINLHYNDERNDWIVSCTMEHSTRYESGRALNPVDACYEMIIKLKENNLL